MKKVLIVIGAILSLLLIIGVVMFFIIKSKPLPVINIGTVSLENVKDGLYTGEYKSDLVSAVVSVKVSDNKITSIDIVKHECGLGRPAEKITDTVISKQSLQVDTVSGATHSSKAILKAIEKALTESGGK